MNRKDVKFGDVVVALGKGDVKYLVVRATEKHVDLQPVTRIGIVVSVPRNKLHLVCQGVE